MLADAHVYTRAHRGALVAVGCAAVAAAAASAINLPPSTGVIDSTNAFFFSFPAAFALPPLPLL